MSVVDLVFGAPRLLEWLGWSITKRPHLLGIPTHPHTMTMWPALSARGHLHGCECDVYITNVDVICSLSSSPSKRKLF